MEPSATSRGALEDGVAVEVAASTSTSPPIVEIALAGDDPVAPRWIALDRGQLRVLALERTGLVRYAIDVGDRSASPTHVASFADHSPSHAALDGARQLVWWTTPSEQQRIPQERERGELVLTRAHRVATSAGTSAELRRCPEPDASPSRRIRGPRGALRALVDADTLPGTLATRAPPCDHRITALLPVSSGLLIGGSLAAGALSEARPWLGIVSPEGVLAHEATLEVTSGMAAVDGLVATDAGVFALAWSRFGEVSRGTLTLFREGTLEQIASAPLATTSHTSSWSAMAAAPDGGLYVVVPRTSHELVLVVVAPDGAIVREQTIEGLSIGFTQLQLDHHDGALWLAAANPFAARSPRLDLTRLDPTTGVVLARHDIALPATFEPSARRMLAIDGGYVLAGRLDHTRSVVLWVPLPSDP
ncbi:MAG: hypothetical protein M3Y87_06440 [Myxococcota bacterium]|nr:hypothetical protein [Myxococcota bacterium]